jgi:hypothetical protein
MLCRDLERGRRHDLARPQCVNARVVAGPTFAREPIVQSEVSESLREPSRASDRLPVFNPKIELAANHAWVLLVSSGRTYRSDRTPGACRFDGVVVALALTV